MTKPETELSATPDLPATVIEAEAVDTIAHWVDLVGEWLTTEASRRVLRHNIRDRLLRQEAGQTMQVIDMAEGGHQDADLALRELAAEYISRHQELPTELANFVQRALLRPPITYPPGRNIADTWVRDIGIAVMVRRAMDQWNVPATRSHYSRRNRRRSACYLVAVALGNRGINIAERRVEKIHSTHVRLAERLSASMTPI
jgi:hypothetical protein